MTVEIKQRILRDGARNRPYTRSNSGIYKLINQRKAICIHETGNRARTAGAANHAAWLYNNPEILTGYHYTVDHQQIYQHIPVTEGAWHAGDGVGGEGNRHSVGIEICVNMVDFDYPLYLKAIDNAAWLSSELINKERTLVFPGCMKQHYDFSRKNCPQIMRQRSLWPGFMDAVGAYLAGDQVDEPWPVYPIPRILKTVGIEYDGKRTKEVGFLAHDPVTGTLQTYARVGFTAPLPPSIVTGHNDHIKIATRR